MNVYLGKSVTNHYTASCGGISPTAVYAIHERIRQEVASREAEKQVDVAGEEQVDDRVEKRIEADRDVDGYSGRGQ